ncbi:hypothetical protein ACSBR1_013683 [Camellia fascicularis]
MATYSIFRLFIFSFLILKSLSQTHPSPKQPPKSLILPVSKHPSTLQYTTQFNLGTPLNPQTLLLDLGGRLLWIDCENGYNHSSTYRPGLCGSATCSAAKPIFGCELCLFSSSKQGFCNNNTCLVAIENTITTTVQFAEIAIDTISIGPFTMVPNFIFGCASAWLIKGLDSGINGVVGLGRTRIGFPTQLSSRFGGTFRRKFALCLPSSTSKSNGIVVFGDARYVFYPNYNKSKLIDLTTSFSFTKLFVNPVTTADDVQGEPSADYFIGVTSITINKKPISQINTTLLSIDKNGFGGTKISTVKPYTVLESSIYNLVTENFAKELEAMNVARVAPMTPFTECFSTKNLKYNLVGVEVPNIGFVFENKDVYWDLHGANLMVEISREVVCLGLLDGGLNPRTSIVIGAHQLEDNLLQFDLAASKLGFTSTLLEQEVECANFVV